MRRIAPASLCLLGSVLAFPGCTRTARIPVCLPPAGETGADRPVVRILTLPPPSSRDPLVAGAAGELQTLLLRDLVRGERFRAVPGWPERPEDVRAALAAARRLQADLLLVLRLGHLEIQTGVHHVRRYHDGSASGEAAFHDPRSGRLLRVARESVQLSARARYSSRTSVRDALLTRLGAKLSASLLDARPAGYVELEDPPNRTLRAGIEEARRGEWRAAVRSWSEFFGDQLVAPSAHYNVGVAQGVLGRKEEGIAHLEVALSLEPGNRLFETTLRRFEARGVPWEEP